MHHIFIVSDGTGRTADQALRAALTQFPAVQFELTKRVGVRTIKQINEAVRDALKLKAFIIFTLVSTKLREAMVRAGRLNNVETIDIMGPLLSRLSTQLADSPTGKPGLLYKLNKEYFQRIDCMQFAFNHDDGKRIHDLQKAEIVLLGVSRTFKTPLSIYLAFKGWFVANIPIVLGMEPNPILYEIPPERVYCLTTNAQLLAKLRKAREDYLGGITGEYAHFDYVRRELLFSRQIFSRNPNWSVINVTSKPVEEIASEIIAISGRKEIEEDHL